MIDKPQPNMFSEMLESVEAFEREEKQVCELQRFMELNKNQMTPGTPLFISCRCKRCMPFTL